jgi:hypothetical protein
MAKKGKKRSQTSLKKSNRRKKTASQTNAPFAQEAKRRIGQYSGAGEPPLMKK